MKQQFLVESLAVKDGTILNLSFHESRYQSCYKGFYGREPSLSLLAGLKLELPKTGYHKLRIEYSPEGKSYSTAPYTIKPINTLKLIISDTIDYKYKYAKRDTITSLLKQKEHCDDILIIKNGLVSDTSAGNIVFYDGKHWTTPDSPLLKGTHRARLLEEGIISEATIKQENISNYIGYQIINAMRPFNPNLFNPIKSIVG